MCASFRGVKVKREEEEKEKEDPTFLLLGSCSLPALIDYVSLCIIKITLYKKKSLI